MNPESIREDENDTDYDVFASVRPEGISVDDNPDDQDEDYDEFSDLRPGNEFNIADYPPEREFSQGERNKDYIKQAVKETVIGAGGTYGDLRKLATGSKPDKIEEKIRQKFKDDPNYEPSIAETYALGENENISGIFPTSKGLRKINEALGGPGEPETVEGRYGKRQGNLYGSGLAFGQVNPLPAYIAGAAGQTVEEAGGGPILQIASEIATLLLTQGKGGVKNALDSSRKEVQQKVDSLRQLGYTDEQITLAINSASKGKKGGIRASKGPKTEKAFEDFAEHSDQMVNNILEKGIAGFENGPKHVHELASDAYGKVVDEASKLNIKNLDPFFETMHKTVNDIKKAVGHNPAAKDFIKEVTDHTLDIISNPTAENMIDFFKRLNGLGKWVGRNQKDRIISNAKEAIKDTFKQEGKEGKALADKFEKVNSGVQKAFKAEEIHKLIQKASTQDGIDFNKFHKIFDKKSNVQLFEDLLGPQQTKNLQQISKVGKEIKDFDKAWKATNLLKGSGALDIARGGAGLYYLWKGDIEGLAYVLAAKGVGVGAKKLSEKLLTDPKFQNLYVRGLHAIKNESPKAFASVNVQMKKYLNDQDIDMD